jgi:hypothetical protein
MIRYHRTLIHRTVLILTTLSLLFTLLSANAFIHVHYDENGRAIIHSHPFRNASEETAGNKTSSKHSHTNCEYLSYLVTGHSDKAILTPTVNGLINEESRLLTCNFENTRPTLSISFDYALRAPPLF